MSLKLAINLRRQWIHGLVLLSLLLGQLALGLGATQAHQTQDGPVLAAICTSSGVQYIELSSDAASGMHGQSQTSASGSCFFCTVSTQQLRFDLQDAWRIKMPATGLCARLDTTESARVISDFLAQHPAPRAPPRG